MSLSMIAVLFNLGGPDILLILIILGLPAMLAFTILMIIRSAERRRSTPPPLPRVPRPPKAERLSKLEETKAKGLISEAEYEEQRRRIESEV